MAEGKTWTPGKLAERAGLTASRIRQLLRSGEISGTKHGEGRRGFWTIPQEKGVAWLKRYEQERG